MADPIDINANHEPITDKQKDLCDAGSDYMLIELVLQWINALRKKHCLGPVDTIQPGKVAEICECPIATTLGYKLPAGGPVAGVNVMPHVTSIMQGHTKKWFDYANPFYVQYFVDKFDQNPKKDAVPRFGQFVAPDAE